MIIYLKSWLLDSPAQTLVNTVNTVGAMGKGIAATFKKIYPDMYNEYRELCLSNRFDIGMLYIYRTPNKIIVNFPTKKHWRYPSKIEYIESGLRKFVSYYHDYGISSVSFPQLGCGHGELDWETQVQPLMEKYLKKIPIPVYIHLYDKSPDFVPERFDSNYAKEVSLERQRISVNKLWTDLKNLYINPINNNMQPTLFNTGNIHFSDEYLEYQKTNGEIIQFYREDIEEIWDVLRMRGTLQMIDLPERIKMAGGNKILFDLLGMLGYVKKITMRSQKVAEFSEGLQYDPEPQKNVQELTAISV